MDTKRIKKRNKQMTIISRDEATSLSPSGSKDKILNELMNQTNWFGYPFIFKKWSHFYFVIILVISY